MAIGFDTFFSEIVLKTKFDGFLEDEIIDWNSVVSHYYAESACFRGSQVPPFMLADVFYSESFRWVDCQNFRKDIFAVLGKGFGHFVLTRQNFLVKF